MLINGILFIYHHYPLPNAPTIMEHIHAFPQYSRFKIWSVNTHDGFPKPLYKYQFKIVLLHYSLFGCQHYLFTDEYLNYIAQCNNSYKIAFFQDEYHNCHRRFDFLDKYNVDCIYTLLEPEYFSSVYLKYTKVPKCIYNLTGYVSDELIDLGKQLTQPFAGRTIDVGYRGRPLSFYMGKGAQEKTDIADEFNRRAQNLGLNLDIATSEASRIYGQGWHKFLANCRAVLGVEAGVSIFDIDDVVQNQCEALLQENPHLTFAEISAQVLQPWEDNIFYRTISPRHFEAAALRVVQILFEGKYSGLMQPMVHYIPLQKDFSNFDQVIHLLKDEAFCTKITENAYQDLIASGKYSYRQFIADFDQQLVQAGFSPQILLADVSRINYCFQRYHLELKLSIAAQRAKRQVLDTIQKIRAFPFPGRRFVVPPLKRLLGLGQEVPPHQNL